MNKSPLKIWEKRESGRIQGLPKFLEYCIIPGSGKDANFKFGRYIQGPSEQNPIKNLGENRALAYPGTAKIFSVPPIISGMGKATNFKFWVKLKTFLFW